MLVTIARTKGGKSHHAVSVDAKLGSDAGGRATVTGTGHVSEWTDDPAKAGRFPEEVAKHVAKHYEGRLNAGDLVFRDERGKVLAETEGAEPALTFAGGIVSNGTSAAAAESKELHDLRAERDEFQGQAKALGAENERLHGAIAEGAEKFKGLLAERDRLLARVTELEKAAKAAEKAEKAAK